MELKSSTKFCFRCAHPLSISGSHLHCLNCGLEVYLNPKPCTGLLLTNDNNEYLLTIRGREPAKGLWDVAGGFVDAGETFEQGMRREAKEELGLELGDLKYVGSFSDKYRYQDVEYLTVSIIYESKLPKAAVIKPADDVTDFQFFKLNDIPRNKLAFGSLVKLFDSL